jgi:hypothetical protein
MSQRLRWIVLAAVSGACVLVSFSSSALAQVVCRSNETQAECHARLRCKADEDLEQCQRRLRAAWERREEGGGTDGGSRGGERDDGRDGDGGAHDRGDGGAHDRGDGGGGGDRGSADTDRGGRGRDTGGGRRRGRARGHGASRFSANKVFGLGLELGEPSGLTGKYFVSPAGALDFGVGAVYRHYYYGDGVHLYLDYLWHPTSLVSSAAFELPFYIGGGVRFWDFDYCFQGVCTYGGSAVGLRLPLGIAFDFNNAPLDIFIQLVPTLDFLRGDYYDRYRDRTHLGIDLSFVIRFWFK